MLISVKKMYIGGYSGNVSTGTEIPGAVPRPAKGETDIPILYKQPLSCIITVPLWKQLCQGVTLMPVLQPSVYFRIYLLSTLLCPSVYEQWDETRCAVLQEIGSHPVVVCGDGRNDSPGFSAKFCIYSLMDN